MAEETEQQFADRCMKVVSDGFTSLCLSVGQRLNLFQHLTESPQSSQQIADSAGLRERYVREWLKSMVVCDIVDVNENGDLFSITPLKRKVLVDQKGALYTMYLPMFAQVFDQLKDCFQPNGNSGIPYSAYNEFHTLMTLDSDQSHNENLLNKFVPAVPGLVDKLNAGILCLDIGCGHGTPSYLLGKHYPNSTFYGIDFTPEAIEFAVNRAAQEGLTNVHYFAHDACHLPADWLNKFDYVTNFDSIHDQAYPDKCLHEIYRILKPGGLYSMIEPKCSSNVSKNKGPGGLFLYTASLFHCMPVSLYFPNGMGLGTGWGIESAREMLAETGFVDADFGLAGTSDFNYHCLSKKPL